MTSRKIKISVLPAVGALVLTAAAFGSSAFATDTATPTPSVSPSVPSSDDEIDVQAILGGLQANSVDVQEVDDEVDAVNNDNIQEQASFDEDINAANQSGNNEDAAQLAESASIVTSVTAPEVNAMTADDNEAHLLITGTPSK
jgi:hypothetical protein